MARIRTIKPEFWTDETVVQLPFVARLLFIGLWNFADDYGGLQDSPSRLRMQIFPGDAGVDLEGLMDLLEAAGLIEKYADDEGGAAWHVTNWTKHQRVDKPGAARIIHGAFRKVAISQEARRAIASKFGCALPGLASPRESSRVLSRGRDLDLDLEGKGRGKGEGSGERETQMSDTSELGGGSPHGSEPGASRPKKGHRGTGARASMEGPGAPREPRAPDLVAAPPGRAGEFAPGPGEFLSGEKRKAREKFLRDQIAADLDAEGRR
jgi:hypothetical protein